MTSAGDVTLYWRPGCGYCAGLLRGLDGVGFDDFRKVNIWEDPDAAAYVRSVADGNEVVPTVRVGDTALVNPSVDELLTVVRASAPEKVPAGWEPRAPSKAAAFLHRVLGGDRG